MENEILKQVAEFGIDYYNLGLQGAAMAVATDVMAGAADNVKIPYKSKILKLLTLTAGSLISIGRAVMAGCDSLNSYASPSENG